MAGSSLLTLLDDIASILDDVSVMSKLALKQTAGVVGDDIALSSDQVTQNVRGSERELPVVWAVAKGSFRNKLLIIPIVLFLSAWAIWIIDWIMLFGAAFLSVEGVHKLLELLEKVKSLMRAPKQRLTHPHQKQQQPCEADKIRAAIRTDFVLSAEIIILSLDTVAPLPLAKQALILLIVGLIMTIGVYGVVAVIVKCDDLGYWLVQQKSGCAVLGRSLLYLAPCLIKLLSCIAMFAMWIVAGGICFDHLTVLHQLSQQWPTLSSTWQLSSLLAHGVIGLLLGMILVGLFSVVKGLCRFCLKHLGFV